MQPKSDFDLIQDEASSLDLPPPEQFLLWAVRCWVRMARRPEDASKVMFMAFDQVGVPDGGALFHRFMGAFTRYAARRVSIRCPQSIIVLEDEHRFLEALAFIQYGYETAAKERLADFIQPDAVDALYAYGTMLMNDCCASTLILARPESTHIGQAAMRRPNPANTLDGNQTVH